MGTLSTSDLLNQLNWRYAVKKFDPAKKIASDTWASLEESLLLTPSSYGLQPWKFLVIQNTELRKQLQTASWNQSQVVDASHYVVFTYYKKMTSAYIGKYVERMTEVRGLAQGSLSGLMNVMQKDLIEGPRAQEIDIWATRQVYIALGNFMTSAAVLGIDTCPLEGLDPKKYDEILGLSGTEYSTVVACAAGYRAHDDKYQNFKKVRFPKNDIIFVK